MVRRAAAFLARHGPVSPQDRWEEEPGYSPFTIATEIAALLVAADLADAASNKTAADYLRETADAWNASIERWLYRQERNWRINMASTAITRAWQCLIELMAHLRVMDSCRSRTGLLIRRRGQRP